MPNANNFLNPNSPLAKSQESYYIIIAIVRCSVVLTVIAKVLSNIGNHLFPGYIAEEDTPISLMFLTEAIFTCVDQLLSKMELQLIPNPRELEIQLQAEHRKPQTFKTQIEIYRLESELTLAKDQLTLCQIKQDPATYCSENIGAIGLTSALVFTQSLISPAFSCSTFQLSATTAAGAALGNRYRGTFLNAYKALQRNDIRGEQNASISGNASMVKRRLV